MFSLGRELFRIRRSVTESYQDMGNTSGADSGGSAVAAVDRYLLNAALLTPEQRKPETGQEQYQEPCRRR